MRISNKKISASVGGLKIPGFIGSAPVTLNGVSTTLDVPFQYINTDNPYIDQWKRIGVSGILGIGVGTGDLTNPLVALPGDLGLQTCSFNFHPRGLMSTVHCSGMTMQQMDAGNSVDNRKRAFPLGLTQGSP
jgi:hypothetical protein